MQYNKVWIQNMGGIEIPKSDLLKKCFLTGDLLHLLLRLYSVEYHY